VTDLIHRRSRGVPRIINVIADATLLFAYGVDRRQIDLDITSEALAELDATGVLASYQREAAEAALATSMSVAETEEALRIADDVRRKEQAIAARERQLQQREQEIAAQQRIVEEEARLLAAARAARVETEGPMARGSGGPKVAAVAALPSPPARPTHEPRTTGPSDPRTLRVQRYEDAFPVRRRPQPVSFWDKVRRVLFGDTAPNVN
jgi:hypothetical protein